MPSRAVVWFRRDLRTADHPALLAAQAERFDPDGDYLRRWVPELAKLPAPAIFAPWQAAVPDLETAGIRLGTDYPHPIVDHRHARDRALSRFQEARGATVNRREAPRRRGRRR
jgi:deoxyribodipyrimidine photolyase